MTETKRFMYEDITQLCRNAAAELDDARPLLGSENFSLFESMSAVEILDEKMDPCYGLQYANLDDAITSNIVEGMDCDFLTSLLRQLVINEVAFLDGASLVESVNQCVYVWPQAWEVLAERNDQVGNMLVLYCKNLVASLAKTRGGVITADIYEDDDYQADSTVTSQLDDDAVQTTRDEIATLLSSGSLSDEILALFRCRIQLHSVMSAVSAATDDCIRGSRTSESDHSEIAVRNTANILTYATPCLESLHALKNIILATPHADDTPASSVTRAFQRDILRITQTSPARTFALKSYTDSIDYLISTCEAVVFMCENVQRFVMHTAELDLDCMYGFLIQVSRKKYSVLPRSLLWGLFHTFKSSFSECVLNSMKHWGIPGPLVDSEMATQWSLMLAMNIWDFLKVFTISRARITSRLESLSERVGQIIQDSHAMDEHVRRTLHAASTPEGTEMPAAEQWYMSWAVYLVTAFMDEYLTSLIELNLLAVYEMDCFYWYFDFVLSCRLWSIRTIKELKFAVDVGRFESMQKEATVVIKQSKLKKKKNKANTSAVASSMSLQEAKSVLSSSPPAKPMANLEEFVLSARSSIHKGILRMYLSHVVTGVITPPASTSCPVEMRFSCRYRLFQMFANPPPLQYSDYLNSISSIPEYSSVQATIASPEVTPEKLQGGVALLGAGVRSLKQTKDMIDKAKIVYQNMVEEANRAAIANGGAVRHAMDVRREMLWEGAANLVRASVALSISSFRRSKVLEAQLTNGGCDGEARCFVDLDRSHSVYFPVPNVQEKKRDADEDTVLATGK